MSIKQNGYVFCGICMQLVPKITKVEWVIVTFRMNLVIQDESQTWCWNKAAYKRIYTVWFYLYNLKNRQTNWCYKSALPLLLVRREVMTIRQITKGVAGLLALYWLLIQVVVEWVLTLLLSLSPSTPTPCPHLHLHPFYLHLCFYSVLYVNMSLERIFVFMYTC